MTQTKKGRPRQFSNVTEKQKAYRDRKKVEIELALALLTEVEEKAEALRNSIEAYARKGKEAEIYLADFGYAKWEVRGYVTNSINVLVVHHLLRTGALVETRKDWGGRYYQLAETTAPNS